jgi:hypothetical protein
MKLDFSEDVPDQFSCEKVGPETGYMKCGKHAVSVEVSSRGGYVYLRPFCKVCLKHSARHVGNMKSGFATQMNFLGYCQLKSIAYGKL